MVHVIELFSRTGVLWLGLLLFPALLCGHVLCHLSLGAGVSPEGGPHPMHAFKDPEPGRQKVLALGILATLGMWDVVSWGLMVWSRGERRGAGELGPFLGHPACRHPAVTLLCAATLSIVFVLVVILVTDRLIAYWGKYARHRIYHGTIFMGTVRRYEAHSCCCVLTPEVTISYRNSPSDF